MKKIYLAILFIITSFTLMTPNIYAIEVTEKVNFTISGVEDGTSAAETVHDVNINLYEKFEELYADKVEAFSSGVTGTRYATTIRKGSTVYNIDVQKTFDTMHQMNYYTIQIFETNYRYALFAFEEDVNYLSKKLITTNQVLAYHNGTLPSNYKNKPLGTYELSETFDREISAENGTNITSFNQLPSTSGNINTTLENSVGSVYFEKISNDTYDTFIIVNDEQYNLGQLDLPGVTELGKEPLSPGKYWTENGKRYIYYEFVGYEETNGFKPFVNMNLTDEAYVFTDKVSLYAGFHRGPNGQAYADVLFPIEIDDLLSIEIHYQQRWISLWGLNSTPYEWQKVTRYKDEIVNMSSTWQYVKRTALLGAFGFISAVNNFNSTITEIPQITNDYKANYTAKINAVREKDEKPLLTEQEIFNLDSSLYRVYLNTYSDGRYTGYEIADDIVVFDVMYEYKGMVIHVPYENIIMEGSFGGVGGFNPIPDLSDGIKLPEINTLYLAFIGAAAIFVIGIVKHKGGITRIKSKDLINLAIVSAIVGGLVYFLFSYMSPIMWVILRI